MMSPQFQIEAAKQEIDFEEKRKLETPITRHSIGCVGGDRTIFGFIRVNYEGAEYSDPFRGYDWAGLFELLADHAFEPTKEKSAKLLGELRTLKRSSARASDLLTESAKTFKTLETSLTKINAQVYEELKKKEETK